jgi:peptide N-acetyl-beta-D-glucosaminyl asparaginase amidase A
VKGILPFTAVTVAALALLLAVPPVAAGPSHRAVPPPSLPTFGPHAPRAAGSSAAPAVAPTSPAPSFFTNSTLAPSLARGTPSTAPPPISALQVTPLPTPPDTVPTVMTFLTNSSQCCVEANFTAPAGGPWAMVVLNYTGQAVGGVYDSSYRAYVDQVQVLFGTTPEYGIWYVAQDVTRYDSLLEGTFNFTFLLGAATAGGYFESSVSLAFYPLAPGTAAPSEPNLILPLFHRVFVSTTTPIVYDNATVPDDVVNATLEVWTYGFGPDEFWYASPPTYRNLYVDVNGSPIASVMPFPYINTGGKDFLTWRPITGVFTLSDRPYEYDVTGALGMIEGAHNFSANVSGVSTGSSWLIGGALLLYTNASAGPATTLSYEFSAPPAHSTSSGSGGTSTDSPSYSYASEIPIAGADENVSMWTNASFSITVAISTNREWSNLTGNEALDAHETFVTGSQTYSTVRSVDFVLLLDLGEVAVITSTTDGGYPEDANFTSYMLNGVQSWAESTVRSLETAAGPQIVSSTIVDDRFTGGYNVFAGTEELTGPNVALVLTITFIASATTIDYSEADFGGLLSTTFTHELIGSDYQPPGPNYVETVLVNQINSPLVAALMTSGTAVDLGSSVDIEPVAGGGTAPYSFDYTGVPTGCTASSTAEWSCAPTSPGTYPINATARDAAGDSTSAGAVVLVVDPLPVVQPTTSRVWTDVGQSLEILSNAFGGTGSLECRWVVNDTPAVVQSCTTGFSLSPTLAGTYTVTVSASDSLGGVSKAVVLSIDVGVAPILSVSPGLGGNLTVGGAIVLTATVAGGSGNATYVWFVGNTAIPGAAGAVLTYVVTAPGTYLLSVQATDAAGLTAFAGPFTWTARNATAPPTAGSSSSSPGLTYDLLFLGAGVVVGAAVAALRLVPTNRGRRP